MKFIIFDLIPIKSSNSDEIIGEVIDVSVAIVQTSKDGNPYYIKELLSSFDTLNDEDYVAMKLGNLMLSYPEFEAQWNTDFALSKYFSPTLYVLGFDEDEIQEFKDFVMSDENRS